MEQHFCVDILNNIFILTAVRGWPAKRDLIRGAAGQHSVEKSRIYLQDFLDFFAGRNTGQHSGEKQEFFARFF